MESVSAAVGAAASTPSFPYHFRKEKERCLSWSEIKRKGKKKRRSGRSLMGPLVESIQRQKGNPFGRVNIILYLKTSQKTDSLTEHLQTICLHLFLSTELLFGFSPQKHKQTFCLWPFDVESSPSLETIAYSVFSLRCSASGCYIMKMQSIDENTALTLSVPAEGCCPTHCLSEACI